MAILSVFFSILAHSALTFPTFFGICYQSFSSSLLSFIVFIYLLSQERGGERSEQASEQVSAAERASKASSAEQANE